MVYLKRAVRRRFGSEVNARLVSPDSPEARQRGWIRGDVLPVVIIGGEVFCRGRFSLKEIINRLYALKGVKRP